MVFWNSAVSFISVGSNYEYNLKVELKAFNFIFLQMFLRASGP